MIKNIKISDAIYTNIEPYYIDERGEKIWNIPTELETLRAATIDTFAWLIGQSVKKSTGDAMKLNAANSKAIVLLAKLLKDADTSGLTDLEKSAFAKMTAMAEAGYADSELLNASLDAVSSSILEYSAKIDAAVAATSVDELIELLS